MILILCVDERMGLSFNNRRLSRDKSLIQYLMEEIKGEIRMHPYSAELFADYSDRIIVSEDFLDTAAAEDYCFIENVPVPAENKIDGIILYRWNRKYTADTYFGLLEGNNGWILQSKTDFAGNSHEQITQEVYSR